MSQHRRQEPPCQPGAGDGFEQLVPVVGSISRPCYFARPAGTRVMLRPIFPDEDVQAGRHRELSPSHRD